jgi:hypothetical protein
MELWARIYASLRRSAATAIQSIQRALPARRALNTSRRGAALDTIRSGSAHLLDISSSLRICFRRAQGPAHRQPTFARGVIEQLP